MKKLAISACLALTAQSFIAVSFAPQTVPAASARSESDAAQVTEEQIGGKPFSVTKQVVNARVEQVWQVLTDYSSTTRLFPMMKKCHVLEDHGPSKVVRYRVAPSGPAGQYEYTLQVKETAPRALEWHRLSGDFKAVDGYWKLEPVDGGRNTLVTYSSHVNAGMFIPQMLIKRQARMDMPQVLALLKHHAELSTIANRPIISHANN